MITIPRTIGNYILEDELGRGATSQVYCARHRYIKERKVAVKVLLSQDEDSTSRFSREAELTAALRHPNIVAIYDHGIAGSFLYTVMELVAGGSLRQHMEKNKKVPLKQALKIFRQIGAALDAAHAHKIVHRDVSPGNILLESIDGRALLTDFGIARLPQQSHTTTNVIMGTPGFFSPEHVQSATAVTASSDLYGLGVILYFMLTGELPWEEPPKHPEYRFGAILPLPMRGVDLPPEIDTIFQTLLATDPKKRYPTTAAAIEAIDRALVRAGVVLERTTGVLPETTTIRAINTAPSYQSVGVLENDVEHVLASDLVREPIEKAHARANELRDPMVLANVLDTWSRQGKWWEFRRPHLGRIINLRSVTSRNVYFYELKVLLEQRATPETIEEPDKEAQSFGNQREQERWAVKLPKPKEFKDDPGKIEIIPGSERVLQCAHCNGEGRAICTECKGTRRVFRKVVVAPGAQDSAIYSKETVTAAPAVREVGASAPVAQPGATPALGELKQTLVPCPSCDGAGARACEVCQTVGRLVQRKVFQWKRMAHEYSAYDDLPNLNEQLLQQESRQTPVYVEQANSLKREWSQVKALQKLIAQVEQLLTPDVRVALAEVTVHMIPFTEAEFDLGQNSDVALDQPNAAQRPDDTVHRVQIYGFERKLHVPTAAYDQGRRLMVFGLALMTMIVVIYTLYVFLAV